MNAQWNLTLKGISVSNFLANLNRLFRLDVYRKVSKDFTQPTTFGALGMQQF